MTRRDFSIWSALFRSAALQEYEEPQRDTSNEASRLSPALPVPGPLALQEREEPQRDASNDASCRRPRWPRPPALYRRARYDLGRVPTPNGISVDVNVSQGAWKDNLWGDSPLSTDQFQSGGL